MLLGSLVSELFLLLLLDLFLSYGLRILGHFGQRLLVLHFNYNLDVAPTFDLMTSDWGSNRPMFNVPELHLE